MKAFLLTAESYNDKSLNNFFKLLKENLKNKPTDIIKLGRSVENKKIVTILKSPHVNKSAQEQFEKRKKIAQILLISNNFNKTIIIIKKVLNVSFHDIKLTIKYLTNSSYEKTNKLSLLRNTNFKLKCLNKNEGNKTLLTNLKIKHFYRKKKLVEFKTYLNILNSYGEINLKK